MLRLLVRLRKRLSLPSVERNYVRRNRSSDWSASGEFQQRPLWARAGRRRIARQGRRSGDGRDLGIAHRRGTRNCRYGKSVLPTVAAFYPELMTEPLPETVAGTIATEAGLRIDELLKNVTVLAIGPGISRDPHTTTFVRSLVANSTMPIVLDADGLNAFQGHTQT